MNDKFIVTTNKKEKIKLESRIVAAEWLGTAAHGGTEVEVRVKTVFVAEESTIEIKGRSSEGKAPDSIKGKVLNNEFRGKLLIPEKVKPNADIWFEAKLPKHGVSLESDPIPAKPPILVSRICWDRQEVHREEEVKLTCQFISGVFEGEDAIFGIYDHNPNSYDHKVAVLRTTIKGNKAEAIWLFNYHEDTDQIGSHEELQEVGKSYVNPQYYFVAGVDGVAIGDKRESGLLKFKDNIIVRFPCDPEIPVNKVNYTLHLPDGTQRKGVLDKDGEKEEKNVAPGPGWVEFEDCDGEFKYCI